MDVFTERAARYSRLSLSYLIISYIHIKSLYGQLIINNASSSPAHITALKGSSVQLHWSYTLDRSAVPTFFTFKKQTWFVNETLRNMVTVVAEKTTYSGQLKVSGGLPSSLSGRISVVGSKDILVINNLNYNDSFSRFYSTVVMTTFSGSAVAVALKPIVQVTVEDSPSFLVSPPKSFEVVEKDQLQIAADFVGNPEPYAEVEFRHSWKKSAMTVTKLYPFIYRATYTLKRVPASYCGRTVITRVKNKIGTITETSTVNVILTANRHLHAGKQAIKPSETCVEVEWQKKESGACSVTYQVNYKTANGDVQFTDTVVNKRSTIRCGIPLNVNITSVELKMNSTRTNAVYFQAPVIQAFSPITKNSMKTSISTPPAITTKAFISSTTQAVPAKETVHPSKTAAYVRYGLTVFILLLLVAVLAAIISKYIKKKNEEKALQFSDVEGNANIEETAAKESNNSL